MCRKEKQKCQSVPQRDTGYKANRGAMRFLYRSVLVRIGTGFAAGLALCATAVAAGPSPAQILAVRPMHADVEIDTPTGAEVAHLVVAPYRSGRISGWMLRRPNGTMLRFFLDTNGDNVLDQWRFYRDGVEVYRDIDTNRNGRADQHCWYNMGGTKWAVDLNEDGVIDQYRALSLEELLGLLGRAIERRQFSLLRPAVATRADLAGKRVPTDMARALSDMTPQAFASMVQSSPQLSGGAVTIERIDHRPPFRIPGPAVDGSTDLLAYRDLQVLVRVGQQTALMTIPWVIKAGGAWKLASIPVHGQRERAESGSDGDVAHADAERLQPLLDQLQALDRKITATAQTSPQFARLHLQRARLLREIAKLQPANEEGEIWWKQLVDSCLLAADAGAPGAREFLATVERELQQRPDARAVLSYLEFHRIMGDFARRFAQPSTDFMALQKEFVAALTKFVTQYPRSSEAAEALIQIGISQELMGQPEQARAAYTQVRDRFARSAAARKAAGALRRLDAVGKPFEWSLLGLSPSRQRQLRGKHVVVYFWAPWCEPCKQELATIAELQRSFGRQRFAVVAVLLDENSAEAQQLLRNLKVTDWITVGDAAGLDGRYAEAFGIFSLPTAFLVGPDGTVLDRNMSASELRAALERASARR